MTSHSGMTRRSALATGAAAAIGVSLAGLTPRNAFAAKHNLKASYITFASVITYFAARDRKFFEAEDIELKDAPVANNIIVPSVLSGEYDVAVTNIVDTANVYIKGGDLRVIYPAGIIGPKYPYGQIVVPTDSTIKGPKDLEGKRIAVSALRSSVDAGVRSWLKRHGVDPAKVSIVSVGQAGLVPAIRSKQFDAASVVEPAIAIMQQEGIGRPLAYTGEERENLVAVYVARESWVEKNMDAAKAYVRALDNANEWLMANPAEVPPLISKWCGIELPVAQKMIKAGLTRTARKADMQHYFDELAEYEVIEKKIDSCKLLSKVCPQDGCA